MDVKSGDMQCPGVLIHLMHNSCVAGNLENINDETMFNAYQKWKKKIKWRETASV